MPSIEKAVLYMEEIAKDNSHGYAQDRRGGNPDYDCSSLVATALYNAGFAVNKLSTTSTLHSQLLACGFQDIPLSVPRARGDIFLTPGRHVVMCTDANNIVHASINEKGGTKGGAPGDQTGKEICTRSFYNPSYGWKYHMRYSSEVEKPYNPTLQKGSSGAYVLAWQMYLNALGYNLDEDSIFGENTKQAVIRYQKSKGLVADGIIGPKTWATVGQ